MVHLAQEGNESNGREKMAIYPVQILKTIAFLLIMLSFFFYSKDETGKGIRPSENESHPAEIYQEGDTRCGMQLSTECSDQAAAIIPPGRNTTKNTRRSSRVKEPHFSQK